VSVYRKKDSFERCEKYLLQNIARAFFDELNVWMIESNNFSFLLVPAKDIRSSMSIAGND
jgi:hypothetical protein